MIALTVVMLVVFLTLVPLRVAVSFRVDISQKRLYAHISLMFVPVFKAVMYLEGSDLICRGTIDTEIDVFKMDGKRGINIAKALVYDSVNITCALDFCRYSPYLLPIFEQICFVATTVACALSNCRVHTDTRFSLANSIFGEVVISVSLAEILAMLVKESFAKAKAK